MNDSRDNAAAHTDSVQPPFLYEIRVRGRLSADQWMDWFDDLTVTSGAGESMLRGLVPDHAALYGLLARLRDLAVPLVAVNVLDAEAQRKLIQERKRYDLALNGLLVALYLVLLGGLTTITVFVAPIINAALALALLFAALGGLAHVFWLWHGHEAWRWAAYVALLAAGVAFLVYIPVSGLLPTALGIAIMLFLAAGGLLYLLHDLRRRADAVTGHLTWGRIAGSLLKRGGMARRDAEPGDDEA